MRFFAERGFVAIHVLIEWCGECKYVDQQVRKAFPALNQDDVIHDALMIGALDFLVVFAQFAHIRSKKK